MKTEPNECAFPSMQGGVFTGLTKREYFAAMAMQGMSANPDITKAATAAGLKPCDVRFSFAVAAVKQADELIDALNGEPK